MVATVRCRQDGTSWKSAVETRSRDNPAQHPADVLRIHYQGAGQLCGKGMRDGGLPRAEGAVEPDYAAARHPARLAGVLTGTVHRGGLGSLIHLHASPRRRRETPSEAT